MPLRRSDHPRSEAETEEEMRNSDPFTPWEDPMDKNDPFKPWNDPQYRDDPFAPWNSPFGNKREYEDFCDEKHIPERDR